MGSLVLTGDTSGTVTVAVPLVAGSNTFTIPASTGTAALTTDCLSVGQTWQNVLASRSVGTTYTNSTGRAIFIAVGGSGSAINTRVDITLDGTLLFQGNGASGSGFRTENCVLVPAGSTYVISAGTGTLTLQTWNELR